MKVKIVRGPHNLVQVQFHDWDRQKDMWRCAKIEMDILRLVYCLEVSAREEGKPYILTLPDTVIISPQQVEMIVAVLKNHCIEPLIEL